MLTEPEERRRARWPSAYGISLVALVAAQAFASFLEGNASQVAHPPRVVAYAFVTAALAIGVLALAVRWSGDRDRDRVAVAVATVVVCFLNFSLLFDSDPPDAAKRNGVLVVWLLLTAVVTRLMYLVGRSDNVRLGILIFAAVALVLPSLSYVTYRVSGDEHYLPVAKPGRLPIPAQRPNVYWLMLDGYARPDQLERVLDFDDDAFTAALEQDGFQVSSSSYTSYPRTQLSLASTLEMEYIAQPGEEISNDFTPYATAVKGHNTTERRFRALGYQTIYGAAGGLDWSTCREDMVDICLPIHRPSPATSELEQALLNRTPLGVFPVPLPYGDPMTFADGLADPSLGVEEPFFAFQHVLTPHYPYRYREDCTARSRPIDAHRVSPEQRKDLYRTQVRCINDMVTAAVDEIVERDPSAVIVVQSDHGSDHTFSWLADPDDWTPGQVTERYAAFDAMRLPPSCDADIEGQPLVNTFRIVFACIEGTEPDLLDYRAFAMPIDDLSAISELTPDRFLSPP